MKKNTTKYGPTGILWALYLIVGVVAFLVSDFYFKFTLKDAIIFGAVNLVVVIVITEGLDFIFKKAKLRQERKKAADEALGDDSDAEGDDAVVAEAEPVKDSPKDEVAPEPAGDEVKNTEPVSNEDSTNDAPLATERSEKRKGLGYFARSKKSPVVAPTVESEPIEPAEPAESETKVAIVDAELPVLITGRPGSGKGYWDVAHLQELKDAEDSASADAQVTDEDATTAEPTVAEATSSRTVETTTEPVTENTPKSRGRRANPDAIIDAPTSSIPVITPDMIKPSVAEPAVEQPVAPVVDIPVVEELVAEEPYLSAEEFLNTTKLTSPRAIVREYQRLGGKDDIYSILMERQK